MFGLVDAFQYRD